MVGSWAAYNFQKFTAGLVSIDACVGMGRSPVKRD